MNPQWDTPPNGDFASYVERLTAQAAMRAAASAQPAQHGMLEQREERGEGEAPPSEPAFPQPEQEQAVARARALFGAPGQQLPTEHPLVHGLKLALKKLESSLQQQGIAQRKNK